MTLRASAAALALCASGAFAQVPNPAVTQENIDQTICVPGWAKSIRPPGHYTYAVKRRLMAEQGIPLERIASFELDHVLSLGIGGHPTDPGNLRLQPWEGPDGARAKDRVETALHRAVCAGRVTLLDAQACMGADWHVCEGLLVPTASDSLRPSDHAASAGGAPA